MLILALLAALVFLPAPAQAVEESRNASAVRAFKAATLCPSTGKACGSCPCPGYVVDHKRPLCDGGKDAPENMQYEETRASYVKDRLERELCALRKKPC